jgi:hypothetical protein
VEDTDEAVAELTEGGVVADLSSSHGVVVGAGAGRAAEGSEGPLVHGVAESVVVNVAGQYGLLGAGGAGDRRGSGVVLACFGVGVAFRVISEFGQYPGAEDDTEARLAGVQVSVRVTERVREIV